jgi:hypothetical protein
VAFSPAVQDLLITVQGMLTLFGQFSIDLFTCKAEFVPESEEERSKITINDYLLKMEKPVVNDAVPLPFEDLAQIISAAPELSDYQVPLSFIRRGIEDMGQDRYVEAFYNFFFFLETMFAPGYRDPKRVSEKFLKAKEIRGTIVAARQDGESPALFKRNELKVLLSKTDEEMVRCLVETRGSLHHHSRHRPKWHPEKAVEHEAEALLIQSIATTIALNEVVTRIQRHVTRP